MLVTWYTKNPTVGLSLTLFGGHQVSSSPRCAGDRWDSPLTGALLGFPPQPSRTNRKPDSLDSKRIAQSHKSSVQHQHAANLNLLNLLGHSGAAEYIYIFIYLFIYFFLTHTNTPTQASLYNGELTAGCFDTPTTSFKSQCFDSIFRRLCGSSDHMGKSAYSVCWIMKKIFVFSKLWVTSKTAAHQLPGWETNPQLAPCEAAVPGSLAVTWSTVLTS